VGGERAMCVVVVVVVFVWVNDSVCSGWCAVGVNVAVV